MAGVKEAGVGLVAKNTFLSFLFFFTSSAYSRLLLKWPICLFNSVDGTTFLCLTNPFAQTPVNKSLPSVS